MRPPPFRIAISALILLLASTSVHSTSTFQPSELAKAIESLKESSGRELEREAIWIASCGEPGAPATLAKCFDDPEFLGRLASEKPKERVMEYLRPLRVLRSLAQSGAPDVEDALVKIAQSKAFAQSSLRLRAWIDAVGFVPVLSNRLSRTVQSYEAQYPTNVARALARIGTEPSLALLEREFQVFPDHIKIEAASHLALARNNPSGVASFQRLIQAESSNPRVHDRLIQTLFNFEHTLWFQSALDDSDLPHPPPRDQSSSDVLRALLAYADQLQKSELTKETREGIESARKDIQAILKEREAQTPKKP